MNLNDAKLTLIYWKTTNNAIGNFTLGQFFSALQAEGRGFESLNFHSTLSSLYRNVEAF